MRVARSALEEKWSVRLVAHHPAWPWLIEHVTVLTNRCKNGKDWKTSHESCKEKPGNVTQVTFGERAM